jgi:hypothetical protein
MKSDAVEAEIYGKFLGNTNHLVESFSGLEAISLVYPSADGGCHETKSPTHHLIVVRLYLTLIYVTQSLIGSRGLFSLLSLTHGCCAALHMGGYEALWLWELSHIREVADSGGELDFQHGEARRHPDPKYWACRNHVYGGKSLISHRSGVTLSVADLGAESFRHFGGREQPRSIDCTALLLA